MVRIRHQNGSTTEVEQTEAVEILGQDGKLAVVIIQTKRGTTQVVYPGEPLFIGYCRLHNAAPAQVHRHTSTSA